MRQETRTVVGAFVRGEAARAARMETDGETLKLHGNVIAKREGGRIMWTMAGWTTVTTRDRLNGLFRLAGVNLYVCQKARVQRMGSRGGAEVDCDPDGWYPLEEFTA